ncbi:hypothetical protein GCM10010123_45710 [Pilimelia anulata]|uniref:Uncharacterized protein n=1 Tax=Pilimelia anulata TaxID=53371 RepID=A0A8J3BH40_9ACTN|nr:hypothetical protein [Pilimelia anulata]GGK10580.1 hypothetical protein GCM10010123_45710 [Pilimelia anulata]
MPERHPLIVETVIRKKSGRTQSYTEFDAHHYGVPRVGETLVIHKDAWRVLDVRRIIKGSDDDPAGHIQVLIEEISDDDYRPY